MTLAQIERRLSELELKFAALAGDHPHNATDPNSWIDAIHGTFENDATYRKATRLGRAWRNSQTARSPRSAKARRT